MICNVLDCVSVTIQVPDPIPSRLSPFIQMDLNLYFEITSINDFSLSMKGTISEECLKLMEQESGR